MMRSNKRSTHMPNSDRKRSKLLKFVTSVFSLCSQCFKTADDEVTEQDNVSHSVVEPKNTEYHKVCFADHFNTIKDKSSDLWDMPKGKDDMGWMEHNQIYREIPKQRSVLHEKHVTSRRMLMDALEDLGVPVIPRKALAFVPDTRGGICVLGKGAFGEVRLMEMTTDNWVTNKMVAVKRFYGKNTTARANELFSEVKALSIFGRMKGFPEFFGVTSARPVPGIVQEYIGSRDLNTSSSLECHLSAGVQDMTLLQWLSVLHDVTNAVKRMHVVGWIHSNIHTNNVLLEWRKVPRGDLAHSSSEWLVTAKLIDLGKAVPFTDPSNVIEQFEYETRARMFGFNMQIAPEVISGKSPYTFKSDIYSLGLIFRSAGCKIGNSFLDNLGQKCMKEDPVERPNVTEVVAHLDAEIGKS